MLISLDRRLAAYQRHQQVVAVYRRDGAEKIVGKVRALEYNRRKSTFEYQFH